MAKLKFNPVGYQDLGAYALLKNIVENEHLIAEDPTPPTPPAYKVYTALLTQSGVDDLQSISSGDLTIGVTYLINGVNDADWTNVGAPNNNDGTYFVATGITPNSWGTSGTLNYNLGAPVVTVLENTIGNIWFVYQNQGDYYINSDNLFTNNKTTMFSTTSSRPSDPYWITMFIYNASQIGIVQFDVNGSYIDGLPFSTPIEIRVYN
jgi:hypothetical protein